MAHAIAGGGAPRTLLFVSGGRQALPAIAEARRLGLRVLVSDGAPDAPGFRLADAGLLAAVHDADATVEAARAYASQNRIDGVIAVAADVPVTVAAVADALGLPGVRLDVASLTADRLALQARLREAGVGVPWSAPVDSPAALAALAGRATGPLVVRPVDGRGAHGVVRLLSAVDREWAFAVAAAESPTDRVMAEAFIDGPHVRTESLVSGGRTVTVGLSDRSLDRARRFTPFLVEDGGELPSTLSPALRADVEALVAAAATALGLARGTIAADVALGPDGPVLVSLSARLSGGFFCTHEIPLATGVNFVEAAIRLALGEEPRPEDLAPRWQRCVAERQLFPGPGRVVAVEGANEAAAGDGVALVQVDMAPTTLLPAVAGPSVTHVCKAGVVIAIGETREAAVARAEAAAARVRVVTEATPARSASLN